MKLKQLYQHIKTWKFWKDEFRSFVITFLATLAVDGGIELLAIYNGDLSEAALTALLVAAGRSVLKTLLTLLFPTLFPIRKS